MPTGKQGGQATRAVVTIRVQADIRHDPRNKKVGRCAWSEMCTDSTGAHHSFIAEGLTLDDIMRGLKGLHVTRIEVQ